MRIVIGSVTDLCNTFHIEYQKKPKSLEAMLAYRMLGIKGNHAEEFEKANVVVKTIRIEKNNKIKENMSFPTFKFKELVEEDWEDSTFGNYLRETRFLFVVYKFDQQDELRLKGCQFWNIPYDDLEGNVKAVWERTQRVLREGLQIEKKNGKNYNNFPKSSENPVCHVCLDAYSLDGLEELVEQINQIRALNPKARLAGCLIADYERTDTSEAAEMWLRTKGSCPVFKQKIRHSKKTKDATFYRQTPLHYSIRSGAAQDYKAFVAEYVQKFGHLAAGERS